MLQRMLACPTRPLMVSATNCQTPPTATGVEPVLEPPLGLTRGGFLKSR